MSGVRKDRSVLPALWLKKKQFMNTNTPDDPSSSVLTLTEEFHTYIQHWMVNVEAEWVMSNRMWFDLIDFILTDDFTAWSRMFHWYDGDERCV